MFGMCLLHLDWFNTTETCLLKRMLKNNKKRRYNYCKKWLTDITTEIKKRQDYYEHGY